MAIDLKSITENERVFGFMLGLHGVVHLFGVVLSWRWFEVHNFHYEDVWPAAGTRPAMLAGIVWLFSAMWLGVVGTRLALGRSTERTQLIGAISLSVAITLTAIPAAIPGTAISGAILVSLVVLRLRRRKYVRAASSR